MRHRTTTRPHTVQRARFAALCRNLRLAVDLVEQIGLEICEMDSDASQERARAAVPAPASPVATAPVQSGKLAYTIKEATAALGLSRSKLYILMGSGELRSFQVGKRRLIPADALQKLMSS